MANQRIVVIGASAGGVEALISLVRDLPPDLPAAVFVVIHTIEQKSALGEEAEKAEKAAEFI